MLNAIDKMANNGITAITLTKAEATTVVLGSAALKAGSVTINEMLTQAELFTLSAQWGKFAAGGITKFNAVDFVENNNSGSFQGGFLARAMFAEHSITLGGVRDNNSGNAMEAVVAQKIAPGGITSLNMNAQAAMLSLKGGQAGSVTMTGDKNAFKVGAITLVATSWTPAKGAYLGNKTTVLVADSAPYLSQLEMGEIEKLTTGSVVSYIDAFGTGKITSITLTSAQATGTILEKAAFKAGSVSLSDAVDGAYVSGLNPAQLNKIAVDGISAITLTKAQATAELLDIAALKAGSVTLGDAVDGAYLTGLSAAQLAKIAVNGISAITDSAANLQAYQQAHPGALQAFGGAAVTLTGASTAAGVADLQSLLQNSTWVYSLTDTLEHLQAVSADVVTGASSYTLTDTPATLVNLTPAQVALVQGASNAASYDVVAPTFASVTGNGTQVVLTFSEAIQKGSGDIVIKSAADNSTVATIAVSATQIAGKTLTLTLQDALDLGTAYYIEVAAGAVKDTVGNDFAGVSNTPITAASSFDLILISEGAGKASYRVEGDGTVTMTGYFDPGNGFSHYTFTPEHGAAQTLNFLGTLKLQVDAPLTLTGAATTLSGIPVTGAGTVVVLGSGGAQTLNIQTTGSNTINAGAGADVVTLGAGADKVVIGAGTGSVSDSRPAAYDTIHSFSFANDTIALPTTTIWAPGTSVPDGNGNFMNVSAGMASFHMTTSGLARKIAAALYGLGTNKAAVAFVEGGNTYLVYGDGVQGTQNSDIVVELIGVAATSLATVATDGALVLA